MIYSFTELMKSTSVSLLNVKSLCVLAIFSCISLILLAGFLLIGQVKVNPLAEPCMDALVKKPKEVLNSDSITTLQVQSFTGLKLSSLYHQSNHIVELNEDP